jgi:hypothetical protein
MKVAIYHLGRERLERAIHLLLNERFTPFVVTQTSDSETWELRVDVKPPVYEGAAGVMETLAAVLGVMPLEIFRLSGTIQST